MQLNDFLSQLNEEVDDEKNASNPNWSKSTEKMLNTAIKLYPKTDKSDDLIDATEKEMNTSFSLKDLEAGYPIYGESNADYNKKNDLFVAKITDADKTSDWKKAMKYADKQGLTSKQFSDFMSGKSDSAWEAVAKFYQDIEEHA